MAQQQEQQQREAQRKWAQDACEKDNNNNGKQQGQQMNVILLHFRLLSRHAKSLLGGPAQRPLVMALMSCVCVCV